jgi:hypothetical protein
MELSKTLRAGRSRVGRVVVLRARRGPSRRYLAGSGLAAALLLVAVPLMVLRRRNGSLEDPADPSEQVSPKSE